MTPDSRYRDQPRPVLAGRARGFSLVELLVTISILVILLSVVAPVFMKSSLKARQAAREVVQGHLTRARSHAIASGSPTALLFTNYQSGTDGGKSIGLAEVAWKEADQNNGVAGYVVQNVLQRWETLPGNMLLLTKAAANASQDSVMDATATLTARKTQQDVAATYVVFSSNGQIIYPADKPVEILLGPARVSNGRVEILEKTNGKPSYDRLQVNRLTGKARQRSTLEP